METLVINSIGKVRTEYLNGKRYLVAPSTFIVSGVLPGSEGPLYYPYSEISKNPDDWNMMPLLDGHPYKLGQPVSGRDPEILDKQQIGFTFHTHAKDDKLKGEAWFDEELTQKVNPSIYRSLKEGRPVELSTGLYTQNIPASPNSYHSGPDGPKSYTHIATNYKPDHLAVLVDQKGACSLNDGCGILVNSIHTSNSLTFNSLEEGSLLKAMINNATPSSMNEPNTDPTGSMNPQTSGPGPNTSPDGSQSDDAMKAPTPESVRASTSTKEAVRASGNANLAGLDTKYGLTKNTPEAHKAAASAHEEAAKAHEKASKYHNEIGNKEDAMSHAQHAMAHHSANKVHKKLVDDCMEKLGGRPYKMASNSRLERLKNKLISKLTANCNCSPKIRLIRNEDGSMGVEDGEGEGSGSVDLTTMAKALGVKIDARRDPKGYIDKIMSGMTAIGKGLAGDNSDESRPSHRAKYEGEGQGSIHSTEHEDEIEGSEGSGDSHYDAEERKYKNTNPNYIEHNSAEHSQDNDSEFTQGNLAQDEGHELNAFNGPMGGMGKPAMPMGEDDEDGVSPKSEGQDAGNNPGRISSGMQGRQDIGQQDAPRRTPIGNSRTGTMKFMDLLKNAPPEVIAVWNNAVEVTEREKQSLISRIIANVHGEEHKKAVRPVYNRMGLPELKAIAATLPPPPMNQGGQYIADPFTQVANSSQSYPNYLAASGGPVHATTLPQVTPSTEIPSQVNNSQLVDNEDHNVLPLPSIQFEYSGKSARKKA